jgi:hypothetical protein
LASHHRPIFGRQTRNDGQRCLALSSSPTAGQLAFVLHRRPRIPHHPAHDVRQRPARTTATMADPFKPKTMKRKNLKGLALSAPPPKPAPSAGDAQVPGGVGNDDKQDTLEIGVEFQLDLKAEDLIVLRELGSGNGGTVSKVQHAATKVVMARKVSGPRAALVVGTVLTALGHPRGGEKRGAEAHRARAAHHARLQLGVHCRLLRRLPERERGCDNVHGVYGCGVGAAGSAPCGHS